MAWPHNDTVYVAVVIGEVVAGVDVCHLMPLFLLSVQLRLASSAISF
jgi:hypothetical protein